MGDARVRQQVLDALAVAGQAARVEHGLWRLPAHVGLQLLDERRERRRAQSDDHAMVSAELACTQDHGSRKLGGNGFATSRQRARQYDHRVDARHLAEARDWLWR